MFYTVDMIPYPSKTVLEDLLSRSPSDYDSSIAGLKQGCSDELEKILRDSAYEYSVSDIVRAIDADYDATKQRPIDEEFGSDKAGTASERDDYHTRIEDIEDEWLRGYVQQALYGFLTNFEKKRKLDQNNFTVEYVADADDEGRLRLITDFETIDQGNYEVADIAKARTSLPRILRTLQKGSIEKGGSLLSFIIRYAKLCNTTQTKFNPRDFYEKGVYAVDKKGNCTKQFTADSNKDSSGRGFRECMSWISNNIENDPYYPLIDELRSVCDILGVDLAEEDPTMYTDEVINNATSRFLQSNEEFIENFGEGDKRLLEILSEGGLFSILSDDTVNDNLTRDKETASERHLRIVAELNSELDVFYRTHTEWYSKRVKRKAAAYKDSFWYEEARSSSVHNASELIKAILKKFAPELEYSGYVKDGCLIRPNSENELFWIPGNIFVESADSKDRCAITETGDIVLYEDCIETGFIHVVHFDKLLGILAGEEKEKNYKAYSIGGRICD